MAKITVVTKDPIEFYLYHDVVDALELQGHEVTVVAEGLSMQMWIHCGRQIFSGFPCVGDFDSKTLIRWDIHVAATLEYLKPDLILTGLGSPINLGEKFGLEANRCRTLLGVIEDLWGVHGRLIAIPDFICTTDLFGQQMIANTAKERGGKYCDTKIHITGSPAMDILKTIQPDVGIQKLLKELSPDRVILVAGQDESTTPMLEMLLGASTFALKPWVILPRFHPKWTNDPSKAEFAEKWKSILAQMEGLGHKIVDTSGVDDIRTLMPLAHCVLSCFSNALIEAVGLNTLSISVMSPVGLLKMRESFKAPDLKEFPFVTLGAGLQAKSPAELYRLIELSKMDHTVPLHTARGKLGLDGVATNRAVRAIYSHLN